MRTRGRPGSKTRESNQDGAAALMYARAAAPSVGRYDTLSKQGEAVAEGLATASAIQAPPGIVDEGTSKPVRGGEGSGANIAGGTKSTRQPAHHDRPPRLTRQKRRSRATFRISEFLAHAAPARAPATLANMAPHVLASVATCCPHPRFDTGGAGFHHRRCETTEGGGIGGLEARLLGGAAARHHGLGANPRRSRSRHRRGWHRTWRYHMREVHRSGARCGLRAQRHYRRHRNDHGAGHRGGPEARGGEAHQHRLAPHREPHENGLDALKQSDDLGALRSRRWRERPATRQPARRLPTCRPLLGLAIPPDHRLARRRRVNVGRVAGEGLGDIAHIEDARLQQSSFRECHHDGGPHRCQGIERRRRYRDRRRHRQREQRAARQRAPHRCTADAMSKSAAVMVAAKPITATTTIQKPTPAGGLR